jgi:hypothetical protein
LRDLEGGPQVRFFDFLISSITSSENSTAFLRRKLMLANEAVGERFEREGLTAKKASALSVQVMLGRL